jgi:hypothetical protein
MGKPLQHGTSGIHNYFTMKKLVASKKVLLILLFSISFGLQAQNTPNKNQFLTFWTFFKNAVKANDAAFLYAHMHFPFESRGSWYGPEANIDDVKLHFKEVLPPYKRAMEFVKFDIVLVEGENAYVWLGWSDEDQAYFYAYKKFDENGQPTQATYEEKYFFKLFGKEFKFYKTTLSLNGEDNI